MTRICAGFFSCDLYYISTESITLRYLNFRYSIGNEGNVLYSLKMLNLFHISTVTCEKEHHLSYTHNSSQVGFFYVKRQLIVNSSQNFLTYLSGENMGRRPSSGPSQSPPVVKVRRGTPAPLQCHQCQALFLSLSARRLTKFFFGQWLFVNQISTRNNLHSVKRGILIFKTHIPVLFFIGRVCDNVISNKEE